MSLLTKASLVATPTAYGDGVLNSVKPTNGDGDFDFARASSATRVNEQGLIEKERENLLLQSNQFDTTWYLADLSSTSGQLGYDGSNDAWKLNANTTNGTLIQALSFSGVNTLSFYAKEGSLQYVYILFNGSGFNGTAAIDLSDGAIYNVSAFIVDIKTTNVGSGWYRIEAVSSRTNIDIRIYPSNNNTGGTTSAGNIYIQDAQLEQGLVATDYIETTTTSVAVGITNDIPRINYENGIGSFLLEPQRTNLVEQSEYYESYWNINDVTIISNDAISPEGIQNATRITESATTARHRLGAGTITIPSSGIYISSVFMKKGTARYGFVHFSVTASYTIVVDLEEGIITDTATNGTIAYQNIEDYGNGWYRCSVGGNINTSTTGSYLVQFGIAGAAVPSNYNNYIPQYAGSTSNYLYAYGAQLEIGHLTTYIPTYGSAVTRLAETCNNAGNSDTFNDSEGVLYAEFSSFADSTFKCITISDGTTNNRVTIILLSNNNIYGQVRAANTEVFYQETSGISIEHNNKIAVYYKTNQCKLFVNGYQIGVTDTSAAMPTGLDTLEFQDGSGANNFYGNTKMVSAFKEALSDSELECLTSWSSFERMAIAQGYTIL